MTTKCVQIDLQVFRSMIARGYKVAHTMGFVIFHVPGHIIGTYHFYLNERPDYVFDNYSTQTEVILYDPRGMMPTGMYLVCENDGRVFNTVKHIPFSHLMDFDTFTVFRNFENRWPDEQPNLQKIYDLVLEKINFERTIRDISNKALEPLRPGEASVRMFHGEFQEMLRDNLFERADLIISDAVDVNMHQYVHETWMSDKIIFMDQGWLRCSAPSSHEGEFEISLDHLETIRSKTFVIRVMG